MTRCYRCKRFVGLDGRHSCPCTVTQVGDREWWCMTHVRNAEDCEATAAPDVDGVLRDENGRCIECGGAYRCVHNTPDWGAENA